MLQAEWGDWWDDGDHRPLLGPVTAKVCVLAKALRNTRFVKSAAPDPQQNQALRPSFPRAPGGEVSRDPIDVRSIDRHAPGALRQMMLACPRHGQRITSSPRKLARPKLRVRKVQRDPALDPATGTPACARSRATKPASVATTRPKMPSPARRLARIVQQSCGQHWSICA